MGSRVLDRPRDFARGARRTGPVVNWCFIPPGCGNSTGETRLTSPLSAGLRGSCRRRSRIAILRDTIVGAYRTGLGARTRSDRPVVFRASNCRPREAWEVLQVPRLRGVMAITRAADTASCRPFGALRPLGSFRRRSTSPVLCWESAPSRPRDELADELLWSLA